MASSRLATLYTARTVAAACLYDALRELNFRIADFQEWCADIAKVDDRDVDGNSPANKKLDPRGDRGFTNSYTTGYRTGYSLITSNLTELFSQLLLHFKDSKFQSLKDLSTKFIHRSIHRH